MADDTQNKVAARLTLDISPAQKALLTLSTDYQQTMQKMLQTDVAQGNALIQSQTQFGERKRALTYKQQETVRQMQQDGDLVRQMMSAKFYADQIQQQQDFSSKIKQIELENENTRNAMMQAANVQTMAVLNESYVKQGVLQKESDAKVERENEAHYQKMYQNEQIYQERMSQLRSKASSSSSTSSGALSSLSNLFSPSHMVGVAGGIALYHMMDALMQIPQEAVAAQQSMVKLQQVLEMSPSQADLQRYGSLNGMLQQLQQTAGVMATTYGVDLNVVIDAMSMVGRRFKDVGDIVVATDSALQLFAVDGVPVEDAVTGMEAIMAQFGLTTSRARQAMFEITAAAHSFQVTGSDLVDAITRSGSAFNTMKMNTTESIAAIATLSQMTAQTGSTVGNAWKSIENSLGSDKSIKALKELGIQVYDANGHLNDSLTILQKLQDKWPQLSDQAKQHFATVLAGGKFQYGRLEAFLNDYSGQYQRALKTMKDATAKQQEELVATALNSPTKQMQMTSASIQVLASTIQGQLNPAMIQFLTEVRQGTGYVNDHWQSIEHWLGTGAKLAEAYIAWKIGLAAYTAVMNTAVVTQLRFAAGTSAIIGQRMGFVAGMQAMGGAVMTFTAQIATSVAKLGIYLALFQAVSSSIAYWSENGTDRKIEDLQAQLKSVNGEIDAKKNPSVGDVLMGTWEAISPAPDLFKNGFNPFTALKAGQERDRNTFSGMTDLIQRRDALQKQLDDANAAKQKQMQDEVQKSLDQVNQMIQQQMKNANGTVYGPPAPSSLGGGTLNPSVGGSGSAKTYLDRFNNLTKTDDMTLQTYEARISNTSYAMDRMNQAFGTANASLKAHVMDAKAASDAVKAYNDDVKSLNDHANSLAGENWQLRQSIEGVTKQMNQVDADYKSGKINIDTHKQAIYQLTQEFDRLTQKIQDNDKAIQQDKDSIVQVTSEITSTITGMLQTAYQDEQKIQEQALQNIYQPQIDALTKQKDAVDALINSLQAQWAAQSNVNQLTDLQNQLAGVMADKRFEVVGTDGKLSYTYDTAKAADLQKQIADQETKIQHDKQIQELQDQKNSLSQQITNLQNAYNDAKKQLDDYWSYKLGQDQLQSDADNLILKNGMAGALGIVQAYAGQIISQYQAIQQAASQAGSAVASSLGGGGAPSGSLNSYWQPIQAKGGMYMQIPVDQIVSKYGVSKSAIQTGADGRSWVPWSAIAPYAYQQSGVHMNKGGIVPQHLGIPGVDSVPALLTPGEAVISVPDWQNLLQGFKSGGGSQTVVNVNGPLSFPNITKPSDVERFVYELTETVGVHRH